MDPRSLRLTFILAIVSQTSALGCTPSAVERPVDSGDPSPDAATAPPEPAPAGLRIVSGPISIGSWDGSGFARPPRSAPVDAAPLRAVLTPAEAEAMRGRHVESSDVVTFEGATGRTRSFRPQRAASARRVEPDEGDVEGPAVPFTSAGEDDIEAVDSPESYPYRTTVKLVMHWDNGASGGCSGTLMSAHHVLTAGHCVYDREHGNGWADSIEVISALDGDVRPYGTAAATNWTTFNAWINDGDWDWDQAYVALDRNLGEALGTLGSASYSDTDDYVGMSLNLNHYPASPLGDGVTMYHGYDEVFDVDGDQLLHYIDTAPGSSGGGMYRYSSSSDSRYLLADNSYEVCASSGSPCYYNGGIRFDDDKWNAMWEVVDQDPEPTDRADLVDSGEADLLDTWVQTGGSFEVSLSVSNMGTAAAGSFEIDFYLSSDTSISAADHFMGTAQVDDLGAFASASGTLEFEPPDAAEAGTYYVGWILDPSDEVDEYDEGDNAGHTAERLTLERDLDGDGHDDEAYGGSDCDDDDDDVHPGATEECNGRDDDCDGQEDEASECQPDDGDDSPTDDDPTGGQAAAGRRGGSCSAAPVDARLFGLLAALGFCAGRRLRRR